MTLAQFFETLQLAALAWVYVYRLNGEEEVLYPFRYFITKILKIRSPYVLNPLLDCEYCVAGQLAFWYYLVVNFNNYYIIQHVFFIGVTIFIVELINRICPN